jgi:hypothetical protein
LISKNDKEFLGSILRKDNERIFVEMEGADEDVVFRVGYEGGGFSITRYHCRNGKTYFRSSGGNLTLRENDDDTWKYYENHPSVSFEGALAGLHLGKDVLALRPSVVHDDVREQVRTLIEGLLGEITGDDRVRMDDYLARNADDWLKQKRY